MAIQVSGTTVIDDSRNLVNVIGIKTVNSTSLLGSGDIEAGASTTYGAVGTYVMAAYGGQSTFNLTVAGSDLSPSGIYCPTAIGSMEYYGTYVAESVKSASTLSGTWRIMGDVIGYSTSASFSRITLFVRTV
jgi:hypothetical protein